MATVHLEGITKRFPDGTEAVKNIDLTVQDREFLVLVGPSGCGKSTTLRMIAGLESSSEGVIRIGDRTVNDVAPKDRDIAMVFQNYALYPHMSVYKNLSFGLTLRYGGGVLARGLRRLFQPGRAKELASLRDGIDKQVRQTAKRLDIESLLNRKPHQLSGGERQRVALGRAIVRNPAAFLFDEPLSNLDAKLRQKMRIELKRLHGELNATMIYVTHDQVEAMTLGDRVAVMNKGEILQVGQPLEIYNSPVNLFVARFVGSVPVNLRAGVLRRDNEEAVFEGNPFQLRWRPTDNTFFERVLGANAEREVVLGVRSEDISMFSDETSEESGWTRLVAGKVLTVDHLGDSTIAYVEGLKPVSGSESSGRELSGSGLSFEGSQTDKPEPLITRLPATSQVSIGSELELAVHPTRVMWFDRHTSQNLLKEKS